MIQAIILAGGRGTRIKKVTKDEIPKVMLPVNDKPFLLYVLNYLKLQAIKDIILSVGFRKDIIKSYFKNGKQFGLNIVYSEESNLLGTGGALKNAKNFIQNDNFLLLNGDTLFKINLNKLLQFHYSKKAQITVALKYLQNTQRYGRVEIDKEDRIVKFIEKGVAEPGYINGGIYILNKSVISVINEAPCSFERQVLPEFIGNSFYGKAFNDYFIDIGIPEDYERARVEIEHGGKY